MAVGDLQWLSGLFLGIVFIIAGSAKLVYWKRFRDTLAAMEILPRGLTNLVTGVLPPLEILLGISVGVGWRLHLSGQLLFLLLLAFLLVLIAYRVRGGKELVCGCFADFEHKISTSSVILRNGLLLAAGLPLLNPQMRAPVEHGLKEWSTASIIVLGILLAWNMTSRLVETLRLLRAEKAAEES